MIDSEDEYCHDDDAVYAREEYERFTVQFLSPPSEGRISGLTLVQGTIGRRQRQGGRGGEGGIARGGRSGSRVVTVDESSIIFECASHIRNAVGEGEIHSEEKDDLITVSKDNVRGIRPSHHSSSGYKSKSERGQNDDNDKNKSAEENTYFRDDGGSCVGHGRRQKNPPETLDAVLSFAVSAGLTLRVDDDPAAGSAALTASPSSTTARIDVDNGRSSTVSTLSTLTLDETFKFCNDIIAHFNIKFDPTQQELKRSPPGPLRLLQRAEIASLQIFLQLRRDAEEDDDCKNSSSSIWNGSWEDNIQLLDRIVIERELVSDKVTELRKPFHQWVFENSVSVNDFRGVKLLFSRVYHMQDTPPIVRQLLSHSLRRPAATVAQRYKYIMDVYNRVAIDPIVLNQDGWATVRDLSRHGVGQYWIGRKILLESCEAVIIAYVRDFDAGDTWRALFRDPRKSGELDAIDLDLSELKEGIYLWDEMMQHSGINEGTRIRGARPMTEEVEEISLLDSDTEKDDENNEKMKTETGIKAKAKGKTFASSSSSKGRSLQKRTGKTMDAFDPNMLKCALVGVIKPGDIVESIRTSRNPGHINNQTNTKIWKNGAQRLKTKNDLTSLSPSSYPYTRRNVCFGRKVMLEQLDFPIEHVLEAWKIDENYPLSVTFLRKKRDVHDHDVTKRRMKRHYSNCEDLDDVNDEGQQQHPPPPPKKRRLMTTMTEQCSSHHPVVVIDSFVPQDHSSKQKKQKGEKASEVICLLDTSDEEEANIEMKEKEKKVVQHNGIVTMKATIDDHSTKETSSLEASKVALRNEFSSSSWSALHRHSRGDGPSSTCFSPYRRRPLSYVALPDPNPKFDYDNFVHTPMGPGRVLSFRIDRSTDSNDDNLINPILMYKIDMNYGISYIPSTAVFDMDSSCCCQSFSLRQGRRGRQGGYADRGVVTFAGVTITEMDKLRLRPLVFLNDSLINFYLKYLLRKKLVSLSWIKDEHFFIFPTYFYTRLSSYLSCCGSASIDANAKASSNGNAVYTNTRKNRHKLWADLKNWTKNLDIFQKKFLIFPINYDFHWTFVLVCHPDRVLELGSKPRPHSDMNSSPRHGPEQAGAGDPAASGKTLKGAASARTRAGTSEAASAGAAAAGAGGGVGSGGTTLTPPQGAGTESGAATTGTTAFTLQSGDSVSSRRVRDLQYDMTGNMAEGQQEMPLVGTTGKIDLKSSLRVTDINMIESVAAHSEIPAGALVPSTAECEDHYVMDMQRVSNGKILKEQKSPVAEATAKSLEKRNSPRAADSDMSENGEVQPATIAAAAGGASAALRASEASSRQLVGIQDIMNAEVTRKKEKFTNEAIAPPLSSAKKSSICRAEREKYGCTDIVSFGASVAAAGALIIESNNQIREVADSLSCPMTAKVAAERQPSKTSEVPARSGAASSAPIPGISEIRRSEDTQLHAIAAKVTEQSKHSSPAQVAAAAAAAASIKADCFNCMLGAGDVQPSVMTNEETEQKQLNTLAAASIQADSCNCSHRVRDFQPCVMINDETEQKQVDSSAAATIARAAAAATLKASCTAESSSCCDLAVGVLKFVTTEKMAEQHALPTSTMEKNEHIFVACQDASKGVVDDVNQRMTNAGIKQQQQQQRDAAEKAVTPLSIIESKEQITIDIQGASNETADGTDQSMAEKEREHQTTMSRVAANSMSADSSNQDVIIDIQGASNVFFDTYQIMDLNERKSTCGGDGVALFRESSKRAKVTEVYNEETLVVNGASLQTAQSTAFERSANPSIISKDTYASPVLRLKDQNNIQVISDTNTKEHLLQCKTIRGSYKSVSSCETCSTNSPNTKVPSSVQSETCWKITTPSTSAQKALRNSQVASSSLLSAPATTTTATMVNSTTNEALFGPNRERSRDQQSYNATPFSTMTNATANEGCQIKVSATISKARSEVDCQIISTGKKDAIAVAASGLKRDGPFASKKSMHTPDDTSCPPVSRVKPDVAFFNVGAKAAKTCHQRNGVAAPARVPTPSSAPALAPAPTPAPSPDPSPCILHLDSGKHFKLHHPKTIFKHIRTYLAACYEATKESNNPGRLFNAKTMPGFSPPVPVQTNTKDCGVYMLEMIERVLTSPPIIDKNFINEKKVSPSRQHGMFRLDFFGKADTDRKRVDLLKLIYDLEHDL